MTTQEFLVELRRNRVRLSLDGDRVRVTAPVGSLQAKTQQEITARRREIVEYLRSAAAASTCAGHTVTVGRSLVPFRQSGSNPPIFITPQIEGRAGALWASLVQELGGDQPVYGLQHLDSSGQVVGLESVEGAASQFVRDIQDARSHGPYHVLACCAGGPIGYEVAQRLRATGEMTKLAMLDTWPPQLMQALQGSPRAMANGRVLSRYVPSRWDGPLLLLLSSGRTFPGHDPRLFWANLAADCSVVRLPGNDVDDVLRNASILASPLRQYFHSDRAEASPSYESTTGV